jgi:hypothetical protein
LWESHIREDEAIAFDGDPCFDRYGFAEHWSRVGAGVEFAALGASVYAFGKILEQLCIELTAGKRSIDVLRVEARNPRTQAAGNHRPRQDVRIGSE